MYMHLSIYCMSGNYAMSMKGKGDNNNNTVCPFIPYKIRMRHVVLCLINFEVLICLASPIL